MSGARLQTGQAAPEGIAVGVLVAVLLLALAAWLAREARPPAQPPALLEAVARPLHGRPPPGPEVTRVYDIGPAGRLGPGATVLRRLGRAGLEAGLVAVEVRVAFDRSFYRRLAERGLALLDDPLGALAALPSDGLPSPRAEVRRAIADAVRLWRYARELRSMPLRRAAVRAAGDAGRVAADALADAGQVALRRRLARARRPAPPTPERRGGARAP